jgi:lincosamide nucleotidyltransferase A/C/D/E
VTEGSLEGMPAGEVHRVLDALAAAGCRTWIAGGWGVDALVGRQTRPHRDLDLLVEAACLDRALEALAPLGYVVETDWLPIRVEVAAPGPRWVDLHPVVFGDDGHGVQAGPDGTSFEYPAACLVAGSLDGRPVACLSVDRQIDAHTGFEPRDVDRADLMLLRGLAGGS